jgi:hypothetical protein
MPNGYDKNWVRICAAIDGFKVRFGHWPAKVLLPGAILNDLEHYMLTSASMAKIREKVSLVIQDVPIVAQDEFGNQYSYGEEGFPERRAKVDARKWLGVEPDRPDPEGK